MGRVIKTEHVERVGAVGGKQSGLLASNTAVFVAGLCIMAAELAAGRIISRQLGQSLYTWTSCIGVFLAGLAIGDYTGGRLADRFPSQRTPAILFALASLSCLLIPALNQRIGDWPWLWEQTWPARIFIHITLVFILPAALLGVIGPVVAKLALARGLPKGRTMGQIYASGAIGSIAGSYLAGFVLIGYAGSAATMVIVAALLAFTGLLYNVRSWLQWLWMAFCSAVLLSVFAQGTALNSFAAKLGIRERAEDYLLWSAESSYFYIRILTVDGDPALRSMSLDRLTHSVMDMNDLTALKYDYTQVYGVLFEKYSAPDQRITSLMLGGGGYAFPRYAELVRTNSRMDVLEIDETVTRAAMEAMGLQASPGIQPIHMDARQFVTDAARRMRAGRQAGSCDFIFGDTFNDDGVPFHLTTLEFNRDLATLLAPDGLYLFNVIDVLDSGRLLASVIRTCRDVFPHVYVIACSGNTSARSTFVVVCSTTARDLTDVADRVRAKYAFSGRLWDASELDDFVRRARGITLTDEYAPAEHLLAMAPHLKSDMAYDDYMDAGARAAREGRVERAIHFFDRALAANPGSVTAYYNLAVLLKNRGTPRPALELLRRAREINPQFRSARDLQSAILVELGNVDDAMELWRTELREGRDVFSAHMNLGELEMRRARPEQALTHFEDAVRENEQDGKVHFRLGEAYYSMNRMGEAIMHYQAAIHYRPDLAEAYNNLGVIALAIGDEANAHELFAEALRRNPELKEAQQNMRLWETTQRPAE